MKKLREYLETLEIDIQAVGSTKNRIVKEANKQVGYRDMDKRNRKQINSITI